MRRTLLRLARFFVLGLALAVAHRTYVRATTPRPQLEVRVPPAATPSERAIRLRESVLVEEGLALGWPRTDAIIRARLAANLRFARGGSSAPASDTASTPGSSRAWGPGAARAEEDALVEEAIALGMARTDVVVRRRLVERAERMLEASARRAEVTDAALAAFRDAHPDAFRAPGRVRFVEVFVSRQAHPTDFDAAVAAMGQRLRAGAVGPNDAARLTEPLLVSLSGRWVLEGELDRRYGPGFGAAVGAARQGGYVGPVTSTYGAHFVYVLEREPGRPMTVDEARVRLRAGYLDEAARRQLAEHVEALVERYDVVFVEAADEPSGGEGAL